MRRFWLASLLTGIFALFNLAVAIVYTIPESQRARHVQRRIHAEWYGLGVAKLRVAAFRARADILEENKRDVRAFYRRVSARQPNKVVNIQQRLWRMAVESGMAPKTLSNEQSTIEDLRLTRLRVTMPLSGSYDQLIAFLERVERAKPFFVIDQIRLRARAARVRDLDVVLSAYYHQPMAEAGETRSSPIKARRRATR